MDMYNIAIYVDNSINVAKSIIKYLTINITTSSFMNIQRYIDNIKIYTETMLAYGTF